MSNIKFSNNIIDNRAYHIFRIVYTASKRVVPPSTRKRIKERKLEDDLVMEMYTIALELEILEKHGYELGFKEKMRIASKNYIVFCVIMGSGDQKELLDT